MPGNLPFLKVSFKKEEKKKALVHGNHQMNDHLFFFSLKSLPHSKFFPTEHILLTCRLQEVTRGKVHAKV